MPTNKVVPIKPAELNGSGWDPSEYKVIILPIDLGDKFKIAGKVSSLVMPDPVKERDQFAQMEGLLVAVSPLAYTYADWPEGARKPAVGDRVLFAKYAGAVIEGDDGQKYKMVNDKDIAATHR